MSSETPNEPGAPSADGWTGPDTMMVALLVFAGCYIGAAFGSVFVFPDTGIAVLFPPYAVLTAALLLSPTRTWWAIVLAGSAGNFWPHHHLESSDAFVVLAEVANVARALVAAGGVRLLSGGPRLDTLRDTVIFLAFAGGLAPAVGAFIGSAASVGLNSGHVGSFAVMWQAWALSNALTGVTLLPLLVALARVRVASLLPERRRWLEATSLFTGILLVGFAVLVGSPDHPSPPATLYAPLPFLLWAAVRFGTGGATGALSILTLLALCGAVRGIGPLATLSPAENLHQLQFFLLATNLPVLLLAAIVEQHARAESELRQSQSRYRAVVEDQSELICRFLPDGTYTFVNGAYCRYFQHTADELVGTSFWKFLPPEGHAEARELLASITPDHPIATIEHEVLSPGGELRWHQWTDRGFFDDHGRVVEYQAVGRDVTERKRAEKADRLLELRGNEEATLRASELRFRQIADNAPVLIWESGLRNEAVYFNQPWLDFTGRTLAEELEFGWIESIHPDDVERCVETCNAAFTQRGPLSMPFRLRRHDGTYRWILDNGIPHFDPDGTFRGYLGSCVDITEQHLAKQALQEEARRKDEFLAMLGHELRNPLAPIGMAVEILRRRASVDESVVWARGVIDRQVRQLTRLVDDLLDMSRITRGTIRLSVSTLELGEVIGQAVEANQPLIESRRHTLTVELLDDPLPVHGDAVRLTQVFSNLLTNAAKYTDEGGRIAVSARRDDAAVVVTVADDGSGIPPHLLERVFDMFTQLQSPGERSQGLGVGLSLVRRLVEMHDGTVEARSEGPGCGSEFVVRLPLAPAPQQSASEGQAGARSGAPEGTHRVVLVVDDNVDAAESLSRVLRVAGHEALVSHDGVSALAVAERSRPDVVLLDIGMPGMDGLEVARRLRRRDDGWRPLLVATTGFGHAEDRRRSADAGFNHHLVKPVDFDVLESLVRTGGPPAP